MLLLSPLRLLFLALGVALGWWAAGVQHDLACRSAGGAVGGSAPALAGGGTEGSLCYGLELR